MSEYKELSCLAYDLRKKVVEMVVSGKGGHIGGDMSVIDVLVALYFKEMNISPENVDDPDRDRFVMSKGHSVEAYYAVLAAKGFFPMEEVIEKFSKFGSLRAHENPPVRPRGVGEHVRAHAPNPQRHDLRCYMKNRPRNICSGVCLRHFLGSCADCCASSSSR